MFPTNVLASLSPGELLALVVRLQEQVGQLNAANEELRKEITELKRSGKRQAAPFAKGTRRTNPKRPGRKPGMGLFSYRRPPSPDEITEPPVDVPVTADTCPGCGGRLQHEGVGLAYLTNNRAERALRPAVIARKVSQCSKNPQGANAFSAFTSIIRTLARHGDQALVERLCHIFTRPPVNLVPL